LEMERVEKQMTESSSYFVGRVIDITASGERD